MFDLGDEIWYLVLLGLGVVAFFYIRGQSKPEKPKPINIVKQPGTRIRDGPKSVAEVPIDAVCELITMQCANFLQKAKIKILFGSQTGTAEDFSRTLAKDARRHGIYAQVIDLEKYSPVS